MAKLSSDGTYVTVEKGDTLSQIALTYKSQTGGASYQQLAQWNKISNPNLIVIGQKIYLNKGGSSSPTTSSTTPSNIVNVTTFGPLASNDKQLYVTWTWSKPMKETKEFLVIWRYVKDGVYFDSNTSSITVDQEWYAGSQQTTYDIPDGATKVEFRIKPVSVTYTVKEGDKDVEKIHWTADWTDWKKNVHVVSNPVATPEPPKFDIDSNNKLTITLEGVDTSVYTDFKFEIIQNDITLIHTSPKLALNEYGYLTYPFNVPAGNNYKVRCMGYKGNLTSEWSKLSDSVQSRPSTPASIISCKGSEKGTDGKYSVRIEWETVPSATKYEVQHTADKEHFDAVGGQVSKDFTEDASTNLNIVELEPGERFFRVRAINEKGESGWTDIVSVKMGEPPGVPTTWETSTRVVIGEPLKLYWMHNSLDGSSQTWARLFLSTDGGKSSSSYEIKNDGYYRIRSNSALPELISSYADEKEKDQPSVVEINTSSYAEDTVLTWWVKTKGITDTFGEESTYRSIDLYEQPSLNLLVTDEFTISDDGELTLGDTKMETLKTFPFYVKAYSNNTSQTPIGYHLSITAKNSYNTVDQLGNDKTVSEGDEVYSKYFDISEVLVVRISADNVDLENGVEYQVSCTISMDSGLTAIAHSPFRVSWSDVQYSPNAEIAIDMNTYTASIRPYCEDVRFVHKTVDVVSGEYSVSETTINDDDLDDVYTSTGEKVYIAKNSNGTELYYCMVYIDSNGNPYDSPLYYEVNEINSVYAKTTTQLPSNSFRNITTTTGEQVLLGLVNGESERYCQTEESTLVEDVKLSVYRREFDGAFTEIATGIKNTNNTFVTDPHPTLDYARYRIVAETISTGAISYYDLPGHPIGCTSLIIQWDEEWSSFDKWNDDRLAEPPWSGSLIILPYNVDESNSTSPDVTLVEYIGRKHPVSYHGTQLGETASWSSTFAKDDKEMIYALRRLSVWCGNAYVRSPSGVGYWAIVKPSFSLKHRDLAIPVTFDITRVEGGM